MCADFLHRHVALLNKLDGLWPAVRTPLENKLIRPVHYVERLKYSQVGTLDCQSLVVGDDGPVA